MPSARPAPDMEVETALLAEGYRTVGAVDEVGRGALGGPVTVGLVVVDAAVGPPPARVRDSKLVAPSVRTALVPEVEAWARDAAVGHATAAEVDRWGVTAALRLAGHRALARLEVLPAVVLLDGSHDWMTPPVPGLVDHGPAGPDLGDAAAPPVVTRVKADLTCASVAAASILAKVARDARMEELAEAHPGYEWQSNKGYGSAAHLAAIRTLGPSAEHRRSWNLPRAGDGGPAD